VGGIVKKYYNISVKDGEVPKVTTILQINFSNC